MDLKLPRLISGGYCFLKGRTLTRDSRARCFHLSLGAQLTSSWLTMEMYPSTHIWWSCWSLPISWHETHIGKRRLPRISSMATRDCDSQNPVYPPLDQSEYSSRQITLKVASHVTLTTTWVIVSSCWISKWAMIFHGPFWPSLLSGCFVLICSILC